MTGSTPSRRSREPRRCSDDRGAPRLARVSDGARRLDRSSGTGQNFSGPCAQTDVFGKVHHPHAAGAETRLDRSVDERPDVNVMIIAASADSYPRVGRA